MLFSAVHGAECWCACMRLGRHSPCIPCSISVRLPRPVPGSWTTVRELLVQDHMLGRVQSSKDHPLLFGAQGGSIPMFHPEVDVGCLTWRWGV